MKNYMKKSYFRYILYIIPTILLCFILYFHSICGASIFYDIYVSIISIIGIFIPGIVFKNIFFKSDYKNIEFTLVSVLGFSFFSLISLVASYTHFHIIIHSYVLVMTILFLLNIIKNKKFNKNQIFSCINNNILFFNICILYIFLNALWSVRYAHPIQVGQITPSQDFFWNLGNVQSINKGFPVADLRVSGVTLSYHFLTELIHSGLSILSGVSSYDIVAFYGFAPIAIALTGCLYELGMNLSNHKKLYCIITSSIPLWIGCASLYKILENGLSRFGNNITIHTISNINGQATAFFCLSAFLLLFKTFFCSNKNVNIFGLFATVLSFYLLTFSKSPQAAIISIAFALSTIIYYVISLIVSSKININISKVIFFLVITVGFFITYILYFSSGANSSMAFSLTGTLKSYYLSNILNLLMVKLPSLWQITLPVLYIIQSFMMAPAVFIMWVITGIYDLVNIKKISLFNLLLHSTIFGGFIAFYIFEHYSSSQIYFANIALFCMGLLFIESVFKLFNSKLSCKNIFNYFTKFLKITISILCSVGIITSILFCFYLIKSVPNYLLGTSVDQYHIPLNKDEEVACKWLSDNMSDDKLFATNRMHTGNSLEGLSNVYTGLSGKQAYCESFKYAVSNMGDQGGEVYNKYYKMCDLFNPTKSQNDIEKICKECNISYIIFNPLSPGSDINLQFMDVVFQQNNIKIYYTGI